MLKELSVKEALHLLAEKYPEPVEGVFFREDKKQQTGILTQINIKSDSPYTRNNTGYYSHFAIEVPDEYRYMTYEECLDWVCLHGYKGYQVKHKDDDNIWLSPQSVAIIPVENWEYRTIQEIDGKIIYGKPMEFKVRVE